MLDFSLLSAVDQTMEGNRQSIEDTLQRYVAKFNQAAKTPVTEFLKAKIPQLGSSRFSYIVVCEDPLLTTPLHQPLNPNPDLGVPSHYAISMADLELLADLTDRGIDPASMLGSWQRSTARESFSAVLHRVRDCCQVQAVASNLLSAEYLEIPHKVNLDRSRSSARR